jgi:glycosyltransferase involved in cell wall biosynthesis
MNKGTVISVVAPIAGQEAVIDGFLTEVGAVLAPAYPLHEIILVNDSADETAAAHVTEALKKHPHVRCLYISSGAGPDAAIRAGLDATLGDYVVTLRPEEDPVALLPALITRCGKGGRVLCGVMEESRESQGLRRRLGGRLFRWYFKRYVGSDLAARSSDFRVMDRHFVNAVTQLRDPHRNLRLVTAGLGFTIEYFPYAPSRREGAKVVRHTLLQDTRRAINLIIGASHHPLRIVSLIGLFMSGMNAVYMLYILFVNIFKARVAEGWTTASLQNAVMFFFLFLILAVLCEYVGVILREIRARHLYLIEKEQSSSATLEASILANVQRESGNE